MIKLSDYNIKPKKLKRIGKAMIVDDNIVVKEKKTDIYDYLLSRDFHYFPKVIENREIEITEYQNNINYPEEQKLNDLIKLTALLHSKTTYFEEIDEEALKKLYEEIDNNINYFYSYYNDLITLAETHIIMSPKEYLLARNITLIYDTLDNCKTYLEQLNSKIPLKIRKVVIHNNLDISHYIRNDNEYLISWEHAKFDYPIFDLYKLIKRNEKYNSLDIITKYEENYSLLEYEKTILLILLSLPVKLDNTLSEFNQTKNLKKMLNKMVELKNKQI